MECAYESVPKLKCGQWTFLYCKVFARMSEMNSQEHLDNETEWDCSRCAEALANGTANGLIEI